MKSIILNIFPRKEAKFAEEKGVKNLPLCFLTGFA